ncbi:sugar ABC transporter ATP-binding protein [Anaerobranca gottschalkii]|uniref:Monosaccharide ABC transporter ATP-binding protein, CUT2 family (TC 3.A.1.2.-) n=1 Tax=Anaerobranca gottschalkii DSM 13577 TaxID=1120990 RepID=A0A1H9YP73_9FIRM|nr:sugar ABC transporter ATP-binding protein [Anaerobranca gottschalkii]SES70876.1 monosaccharide ABC transporter ATP-binding protein, CUT2 family (TC 3.A.1.2.-) [Anaerobranca gottschalkii DSM 13577]
MIKLKDIRKEYYQNPVLKGINLEIAPGEIHAIVGENGAGKSTLMNILFGMPVIHETGGYSGEIYIEGKKVEIQSPHKAMELGIGMVHQEFMLLPNFTVTENIKLNREITKPNLLSKVLGQKLETLDYEQMNRESQEALEKTGMTIDEYLPVAGLPVGHMQFVEIAREIDKKNIKILVFDEPTAVLTEKEAEVLLATMKNLAATGISILFITHRLDEVIEVAHRITVLRDGEQVATIDKEQATVAKLAELMVGRKINRIISEKDNIGKDEVILKITDLYVDMPGEQVEGFSLEVKKGEIIGIGGLAGHGKIGIANGIMGLYPSRGKVELEGMELPLNNPAKILEKGIAFVSEDRRGVGLLLDDSIEENICIAAQQVKNKFFRKILGINFEDKKAVREKTQEMIKMLDIRCTGPKQIVKRLSGGNQQKVCIARALTLEPKLLFVSEPTRGIDIGAKNLVLELLKKLNKELGMTIIMTSSELGELRSICHRVAIIYQGKNVGILKPEDSDIKYGLLMAGTLDQVEEVEQNG